MFSRLKWFTAYSTRKLEYAVSVQTALFGGFLLLPATSMQGSAGLNAASDLMSEVNWGIMFLGLGSVSLWSLHVNGRASWTPFARMASMAASMLALLALASGFLPWSPGAYYFASTAFLFCGNGFLAASRDAGREISLWRGERDD